MNKSTISLVLSIVAVILVLSSIFGGVTGNVELKTGGMCSGFGDPQTQLCNVSASYLKYGNTPAASSTLVTTGVMSASDFANSSYSFTPNVSSVTLTFPAVSTLTSFIPNPGDMTEYSIINATGTAGITVTPAVGSGFTFEQASTSLKILPGKIGLFHCLRLVNNNISCAIIN